MPHLQRAAHEMVMPLVKHHRPFGECLDDFKTLDTVEKSLNPVYHCLPTFVRRLRLAHTVCAVFREERHYAVNVVAGPSRAELIDHLDIRLLPSRTFGGFSPAVQARHGRQSETSGAKGRAARDARHA